ncbi:olfactory receptor 10r2-like [Lynx pardinus]|uniref:Olfactory receptor 10r2-like n=1 Tax=Lynx pardinus TaxID=191816 RepID=A0A485NQ44_LYNPA|nr:olfactory receptor 10r2-like [Lynx pardinus]
MPRVTVNLGDQVNQANFSSVTEVAAGLLQPRRNPKLILFAVFLCLYLIVLSGNITIVTVVCLARSLHVPMCFFLGILPISETCYTLAILPKMLINLLSPLRTTSFVDGATRMLSFFGFAVTNCMLLGVMGYDHYAAICHPLRKINHCFCDILSVIQLACTETYIHELIIFIGGVPTLMISLTFFCISYGFIVHTILKIPSTDGKWKALPTCASHPTVVIVHHGRASSVYLRPSAKFSSSKDRLVTVAYTVVTPLLNPVVYSLRNKAVEMAIWKIQMAAKRPPSWFTCSDVAHLRPGCSTERNHVLDLPKSHVGALTLDFCSTGITEYMLSSNICES